MVALSSRALDTIGTLARLGLAAVWLIAGVPKIARIGQNFVAVKAYDVLPESLVGPVATAQPFLEVALGVLLLVGVGTRLVAGFSVLLLVLFVAGIAQAWARGLAIDCGCFSSGGAIAANQTAYPLEIARDLGFSVLALWLLVRPRTRVSLDGFLTPAGSTPVTSTQSQ